MQAKEVTDLQVAAELEKVPVSNPVLITDWGVDHEPDDNMRYKAAFWPQIMFVRDSVAGGIFNIRNSRSDDHWEGPHVWVVGQHRSKSIELPVMYFCWEGVQFMFRNNFHSWAVTIRSPVALEIKDLEYLYNTEDTTYLGPIGFGGFPEDFICDAYGAPEYTITAQFSADLHDHHLVWTLCHLVKVARHKQLWQQSGDQALPE